MISIVSDSGCCIKQEDAHAMGVIIAPITYMINDESFSETYADKNGNFEKMLREPMHFSTSHPNPSVYANCFETELEAGHEVLCLTMSSRLSGSYSSALHAARQIGNGHVAVFDTRFLGGSQLLMIKQARKWIDAGIALPVIMRKLEEHRKQNRLAFMVDDMTPLWKSGRLNFVRLSVSTVLNIKPILLLEDGVVISGGVARGNTEIITGLARAVQPKPGSVERQFIINYLGATRLAANLYTVLREWYPDAQMGIQKVGPVLGIHLGSHVVSVSCSYQE